MMRGTVAFSIVICRGAFYAASVFCGGPFPTGLPLNTVIVTGGGPVYGWRSFWAYLLLISRMKDIQRVFMYHGAEHKCINCIEHGLDLTVENVMKSSRLHKRCGTSFLLFVIIVSTVFLMFITSAQSHVWRL